MPPRRKRGADLKRLVVPADMFSGGVRGVTEMPGGAEMARIVSQVTEPMLGITFAPVHEPPRGIGPTWKTAALTIDGSRPLTVAVSADEAAGRVLGARIFRAAPDRVDREMVADGLCELVNMTAGLLKSALRIDQPLGLPSMRESAMFDDADGRWSRFWLRAGEMNLVLAVATRIH